MYLYSRVKNKTKKSQEHFTSHFDSKQLKL